MKALALKARNYDDYRRLLHDAVLIAWVSLPVRRQPR